MRKFIPGLLMLLALYACKSGSATVVTLADRIKKVWAASLVKHNGVTVYTTGTTGNVIPGYAAFTLNLATGTVTLIDLDGTTMTGKWEVSSDEKRLILTGLTPVPDGTNGTIEYTIDSVTDTQLTLTRTTTSAKTGGKTATYVLMTK